MTEECKHQDVNKGEENVKTAGMRWRSVLRLVMLALVYRRRRYEEVDMLHAGGSVASVVRDALRWLTQVSAQNPVAYFVTFLCYPKLEPRGTISLHSFSLLDAHHERPRHYFFTHL